MPVACLLLIVMRLKVLPILLQTILHLLVRYYGYSQAKILHHGEIFLFKKIMFHLSVLLLAHRDFVFQVDSSISRVQTQVL